ncbi:hypothetical protein PC117_g12559, partial [Phytophthora cactorum]
GLQSWHVVDLKAGSVGRPREDALVFVLQHVVDGAHEARHGGEGRVDSIADVQIHFTLLWLVGREVGSEWLWLEWKQAGGWQQRRQQDDEELAKREFTEDSHGSCVLAKHMLSDVHVPEHTNYM